MPGNTFGKLFKLTTFGESHGEAIGGIIDGCPAGLHLDIDYIQHELERRKPGQSHITTQRKETDEVKFLSGVYQGITTGTPLAFIIENKNIKSDDYVHLKDAYRPSHADYVYQQKYGIRDHRGGGRASARETAVRVAAGAVAKLILKKQKIKIFAYVNTIGKISTNKKYTELNLQNIDSNIVRCPDEKTAKRMISEIEKVRKQGDSLGGVISCVIMNCPVGLGEPVFDKLHADLAKAMMSINAVKGFEYGSGFASASMKGSEHNDRFIMRKSRVTTLTNHSGGIQGGISNGMDIYFNVAFKPVATIMQTQKSINKNNQEITLQAKGRHDPCVLPRAVPIVEAMAALVLADHLLRNKTSKI
jgi:chorismate synthase